MRRFAVLLALAGILAGAASIAADAPAAAPEATPASSPPTVIPQPPKAPQAVNATLKDGTKIEFETDGSVEVLNVDGTKTPAPDGILTLRDGVTFSVRNGQREND